MPKKKTAFYWNERCFWHGAGNFAFLVPVGDFVEPSNLSRLPETPESKRRFKNLIQVSGLSEEIDVISSENKVSYQDLVRVHTKDYINEFISLSNQNGGELKP